MNKNILVFVPNSLKYKTGCVQGCYRRFEDCEAFYVTDEEVSIKQCCRTHCIGFMGKSSRSSKSKHKTDHPLFINISSNQISLNSDDYGGHSILEIIYDYRGFRNSDLVYRESDNYGKHFKVLTEELRKSSLNGNPNGRKSFITSLASAVIFIINIILKVINMVKPLLLFTATFLHFEESTLNLKWFAEDIMQNRKLTAKTGNLLIAKIIDILIGIILLYGCLKYEDDILNFIQRAVEDIITNLKNLLLYLMGSPIGLKLNHSFNNKLGKFFFYHISLWRIFLQGTEPLFRAYFKYLVLPGALGFSFQIAMFSDIISIATFHVYCIYVYAARLFCLQVRGLTSLWRLFIGRKSNPLRQRVDSCKYTPDQLFIGTLGFTILLFLLPTTTMYYTVFTTFRLAILLTNGLLLRAKFLLNTIPVYVLVLWIFNSSSVAGTVYLNVKHNESERIVLEAKLKTLPLTSSVKKFVPDSVKSIGRKSYGGIFHSVFTGVLL